MPSRNGVPVATKNPNKKPVWEMTDAELKDPNVIVFDYDELLEFAEGDIAPVFGPQFKQIDNYQRRVRLPAEEYLLVTRVTKMDATPNEFRVGSSMTTEYDLPVNGPISLGGDIPWAILVESGQCDLMLISYMGIDFQCKSDRVYRLLDTTLTFYGVACEGETLVYDIKVNGFAKGGHGEISMFFFEYNCYCNGKLLIEMRNGAAGFFTNEELAAGKGVVRTKPEIEKRKKIKQANLNSKKIDSMMLNPCFSKTTFSEADMQDLVNKKWSKVLGPAYDLDYRLTTPKMLMIDRVTHLNPKGGIYGLGLLIGEKVLDPSHWYFPCHFVKDEVMAGSLVSDGCSQLLKLYMMWLGLKEVFVENFQFRPVDGQGNKVRCRGQISPQHGKLVYVMEITDIGFDPVTNLPFAKADVDIIDIDFDKGQSFEWSSPVELDRKLEEYGKGDLEKKIVVDFKGIALKMQGPLKRAGSIAQSIPTIRKSKIIPIPPGCLITDPNPPKEATWHPLYNNLKNAAGVPTFSFYPSKYPPRPIRLTPFLKDGKHVDDISPTDELKNILNEIDLNFTPGEMPLNFYNMCEFMCGHVSNCLGQEFSIFDVSKTSRSPAFDLAYVTRGVKVTGITPKNTLGVDVDPGVGEMICEFDCPADAWFFDGYESNNVGYKSKYSHLPYSIIMEIALQTSGVLTSILKAPLTMKKKDILFRNLDASSEMTSAVEGLDLRGKTIINRTVCKGYNMLGNMGIHRFEFELFVKETPNELCNGNLKGYIANYEQTNIASNKRGCIYKGETSFGWFVPEVFENQVGLDSGKKREVEHVTNSAIGKSITTFKDINTNQGKATFTRGDSVKESLLRKSAQGEFLDEINVSREHKYMHGKKTVNVQDWFFSCHFWNDPVMPGSLGIESMFQLMEYFAIDTQVYQKLNGKKFGFQHSSGKTSWKYRGQLTPRNKQMDAEIFVKSVEVVKNGTAVEIVADGNLFVDKLRVYETKGLRLELVCLEEQQSPIVPNGKPYTNGHSTAPVSAEIKSAISSSELKSMLLEKSKFLSVKEEAGKLYQVSGASRGVAQVLPVEFADLGDSTYMKFYGVKANLYSGAMAKGIASADLVIAMGKANLLGSFGAGGLPMHVVERNLTRIKEELGDKPFAVNLIHSPFDPNLEEGNIELFRKFGVKIAEASAFMDLTPSVVLFRARGLSLINGNEIIIGNKLIAKCSRTEVASKFLNPAPLRFLDPLFKAGKITKEQYELAQIVPMADDVSVESDSGGHTDNRQMQVILPLVCSLRNEIFAEAKKSVPKNYKIFTDSYNVETGKFDRIQLAWPYRVRVGAGGGIGCPEGALCAFNLGAAFLVTGTINQLCKESGTCDQVRTYLSEATYADVTMAPAADMFDQGVQLQVLKKGTMFPSRAKKLYDLFCKYNAFEEMPEAEITNLEKRILKKSIAEVWEETKDFYINRLHNQEKVDKVEVHGDTKLKMSLCFRWYLGLSSFWANSGDESRKTDYQIWCGPAIGAFNEFIKDSYLDVKKTGVFPAVVDANMEILTGAAYLNRVNQIRMNKASNIDVVAHDLDWYKPKA